MGDRLARGHLWLWAALVVVGTLYAGTLGLHGIFMWDEAEYACLARSLARGEPYSDALRPPILPSTRPAAWPPWVFWPWPRPTGSTPPSS